jgi:exfoliative toxin A/B
MVLSQVPTFLKNGFFPSYAALTFPFIITANSLWESLPAFNHSALLQGLAWLESLFAIAMTLFVFYKYLLFFRKTAKGD